jgi:hypothetical protein
MLHTVVVLVYLMRDLLPLHPAARLLPIPCSSKNTNNVIVAEYFVSRQGSATPASPVPAVFDRAACDAWVLLHVM